MQMRLVQCDTIRRTCVWGPFWTLRGRKGEVSPPDSPGRSPVVNDWRCFLFDGGSAKSLPSVRTATERYCCPEHTALTAPSGPFLRFFLSLLPLEGCHSTQAPPQIACFVVIKWWSDLFLVTQPGRLVVHIGCCCLWPEVMLPCPLFALGLCSELWGRLQARGLAVAGEGGQVCVSVRPGMLPAPAFANCKLHPSACCISKEALSLVSHEPETFLGHQPESLKKPTSWTLQKKWHWALHSPPCGEISRLGLVLKKEPWVKIRSWGPFS